MVDFARVQKELQECNRDVEVSGIKVSPKADKLTHLIGTIPGPLGTPYEGGTFEIDIQLPGNSCIFVIYLYVYVSILLYLQMLFLFLFDSSQSGFHALSLLLFLYFVCVYVYFNCARKKKGFLDWKSRSRFVIHLFMCV